MLLQGGDLKNQTKPNLNAGPNQYIQTSFFVLLIGTENLFHNIAPQAPQSAVVLWMSGSFGSR